MAKKTNKTNTPAEEKAVDKKPKSTQAKAKSAEVKPTEANPIEVKPVEVKPVENNTAEVKPVVEVPKQASIVEPAKKSKKGVGPIILCLLLVVVIAGLVTTKIVLSTPKQAFSHAITKTYKEVSNTLKVIDDLYKPSKEAIEVSGTIKLDTNLDLEKDLDMDIGEDIDLSKIELNGLIGLDIPNETIEVDAGIKGSSEKIEGKLFFEDGKAFLKTSFYDEVLKLEGDDYDIDFSEIKDVFKELEDKDLSIGLYDGLLEAFKDALIKSLDKDAMEKENTTIDVLDKEVKVTKNTYKLTEKNLQKLAKNMIKNLLDDDDFIEDLAKATGLEEKEIKDELKDLKENVSEIKLENTILINIYTKGLLNKFAGIDIKIDKETVVSYYTNGDNIEAEIGKQAKLTVEKDGKVKKAKLTVNDKKLATAKIRSYTKEKIDLDYTIYADEEETNGTIYLTINQEKRKVSGDYKFRVEADEKYLEVSGSYKIETEDELEGFNTKKAVDIEDADENEFIEALEDTVKKDDVLNEIYSSIQSSAEEKTKKEEKSKLNYNNMSQVDIEKAKTLLTRTKPTVMYIGDTYYYSDQDAYDLIENLKKAQTELDFYSYTIKPISLDEAFKSAIADVEFICKKSDETQETCNEWPAILLIRDGEIVKAYRGTVDYNDLLEELKKLGL